jgi:hypothetical protein
MEARQPRVDLAIESLFFFLETAREILGYAGRVAKYAAAVATINYRHERARRFHDPISQPRIVHNMTARVRRNRCRVDQLT